MLSCSLGERIATRGSRGNTAKGAALAQERSADISAIRLNKIFSLATANFLRIHRAVKISLNFWLLAKHAKFSC